MSQSANAQSLGVVWIVWGGTRLDIDAKSSSFNRGGKVATPVVAGNKISQSFSTVPAEVTGKFPLMNGMSLDALRALNGSEMQVGCDSGQTYISPSMYLKGDLKVTGGAGSNTAATWSGNPMSEVMS